jgi:hypothetical protein
VTSMDNGLRVEITNPFVTLDLIRDWMDLGQLVSDWMKIDVHFW